mmetsp:Transcript_43369/g.107913  ORF Transcript_43369/g.107913 Transcript_43369/m.107913 type:complete len:397 (+) Transcript_43369:43-1233(+)
MRAWLLLLLLLVGVLTNRAVNLTDPILNSALKAMTWLVRLSGLLTLPFTRLGKSMRPVDPPAMSTLEIIFEAPTAILSFAMYRLAKYVFTRPYSDDPPGWTIPYKDVTVWENSKPYKLIFKAVVQPRWQTRALVARSTIKVKSGFEIDTLTLGKGTVSWTCVIYKGIQTVASLGGDGGGGGGWKHVKLNPGNYELVLRLYAASADSTEMNLPAVRLDANSEPVIPALTTKCNVREELAYPRMQQYEIPFIKAMHHHVYPMLECQHLLPQQLVRKTVLPIGNPESVFAYGPVHQGARMSITLSPAALEEYHLVHVAVYNRASFPVYFFDVPMSSTPFVTPDPCAIDGIYLVRAVPKMPGEPTLTYIKSASNPTANAGTFGDRLTIKLLSGAKGSKSD